MEQNKQKPSARWTPSAWTILVLVGIVTTFSYIFLVPSRRRWNTKDEQLFKNAHNVAQALREYAGSHQNQLPAQLSALVPQYIAVSNINWLFPPGLVSVDVANLGAFEYLGEGGRSNGVIIFERSQEMSRRGAEGGRPIVGVDESFVARRFTYLELSNKLERLRSSSLK